MSTDYKAQKESCASRSVDILILLYFVFALKMSVAGLLHLLEKFAREEKIAPEYVCVRACVCVRTYVGVAVT